MDQYSQEKYRFIDLYLKSLEQANIPHAVLCFSLPVTFTVTFTFRSRSLTVRTDVRWLRQFFETEHTHTHTHTHNRYPGAQELVSRYCSPSHSLAYSSFVSFVLHFLEPDLTARETHACIDASKGKVAVKRNINWTHRHKRNGMDLLSKHTNLHHPTNRRYRSQ